MTAVQISAPFHPFSLCVLALAESHQQKSCLPPLSFLFCSNFLKEKIQPVNMHDVVASPYCCTPQNIAWICVVWCFNFYILFFITLHSVSLHVSWVCGLRTFCCSRLRLWCVMHASVSLPAGWAVRCRLGTQSADGRSAQEDRRGSATCPHFLFFFFHSFLIK